jgi:hypothetical protein
MSNLLVVESENDKFFIDALIRHLNLENIEVSDSSICDIDDYECLSGLSSTKLVTVLNAVKFRVKKEDIQNIGILIDIDNKTITERLTLINDSVQNVFETQETLTAQNIFTAVAVDEFQSVQIATYFTNAAGKGELETLLKAIKSESSIHADCLDSWQECLQANNIREGQGLKPKDFDKFWVQMYIRYDTCTKKESTQAGRKCNNEAAMNKPIWNFDHEYLSGLKTFLTLFAA